MMIMTMMMSVLEYSEYSSAGKVSNAKATNQGAGISYDGDDSDDDDDATDADDDDTDADDDADDDDDATDADDADDDDADDDNATEDANDDDYGEEEMDDCLMKVNTGVSSITLSAFRSPKFDIPLKKLCI